MVSNRWLLFDSEPHIKRLSVRSFSGICRQCRLRLQQVVLLATLRFGVVEAIQVEQMNEAALFLLPLPEKCERIGDDILDEVGIRQSAFAAVCDSLGIYVDGGNSTASLRGIPAPGDRAPSISIPCLIPVIPEGAGLNNTGWRVNRWRRVRRRVSRRPKAGASAQCGRERDSDEIVGILSLEQGSDMTFLTGER